MTRLRRILFKLTWTVEEGPEKVYRYEVSTRKWAAYTYIFLLSPLILLMFIFEQIQNKFEKTIEVQARVIETTADDKTARKIIFEKLLEND